MARVNLTEMFNPELTDSPTLIVHGYGVKLTVNHGQLTIHDGICDVRRNRRIPKVNRTIKRIVITGLTGYISLEALRWCNDHNISIVTLDADGDLVASYTPDPPNNVTLLRAQALAAPGGSNELKGLEVIRYLLDLKLKGQSANLIKLLSDNRSADRITHYADMIPDATTFDELNELERWAAGVYFTAWQGNVSVPWPADELERVPSNWLTYEKRNPKPGTSGNRNATDPINAMLNYAYTLGYTESRTACVAHSISPELGFLHSDSNKRDSMALDLLEVIRPDIDAYILGLLGYGAQSRTFTYRDFNEPYGLPPGTVRLVAPLSHEIAEYAHTWYKRVAQAAKDVVTILNAPAGAKGQRSKNLKEQRVEFMTREIDLDKIMPVAEWEKVRSILPPDKVSNKGGFPAISHRNALAAMIYLEHHRKPWRHVPPAFGISQRSLTKRRQDWRQYGYWDEIWAYVLDRASKPLG